MAFSVEENVPPNPISVALLGAKAVTFDPQVPTDAVEQLRAGRCASRWRGKLSEHGWDGGLFGQAADAGVYTGCERESL